MKIVRAESGDINLAVVAIALPIFLMLVAAAIDLARIPLAQQSLQNALSYAASNLGPNWKVNCEPDGDGNPTKLGPECIPSPDGSAPAPFGIEPFMPAVYALSKNTQYPGLEIKPLVASPVPNPGCSGVKAEKSDGFLCREMPNELSKKAVSLVFYYLQNAKKSGQVFGLQEVAVDAAFARLEVERSGEILSTDDEQAGMSSFGAGYNFSSFTDFPKWSSEFISRIDAYFGLKNGNTILQKFRIEWLRNFLTVVEPSPVPRSIEDTGSNVHARSKGDIAWEISGICPSNPICFDNARGYIPPAFLSILGVARVKSLFGTFALFGESNERWFVEYHILPLQNIYGFSEGYWIP